MADQTQTNQPQQPHEEMQDYGIPTPSQAEGEEEPGQQHLIHTTPSQAEGDLETVEEDLRQREG